MKKTEIEVGGLYLAKVSGNITTVRVDAIREPNRYDVTNLTTGRKTTFRSAAKFRGVANPQYQKCQSGCGRMYPESTKPWTCIPCAKKMREEEEREEREKEYGPTESSEEAFGAMVAKHDQQSEDEQSHHPTLAVANLAPCATATDAGILARISAKVAACASQLRSPGSPVAGMTPNAEQESILEVAEQDGLRVLVVGAGAGTGKTATLKMLEEVLPGNGQYTAFNSSLVTESKGKFRKAACNTTHSLAFRAVGKQYQHRLNGERMRGAQIARILGIEPLVIVIQGEVDSKGNPRLKTLSADMLAGQVTMAIRRFCQSADREIGGQHLRYLDGIDGTMAVTDENGETRTERCKDNNNRVREYLTPFLTKAWEDLRSVNGVLPFSHDVYVKLWQLGTGNDRPIIAADYILLDEAQDTAPVFLDILKQQTHALLVLVGDDNQQIYEWRGAVNAMASFRNAPRRLLSQSYRFGQVVADVANAVLAELDEPTDLVMRGNPALPSRIGSVERPRCHLFRTNAGAIGRMMHEIRAGRKPHLIGGGSETVAWCQAAIDLQARRGTRHPELACFESWGEVEEYAKTDEGEDMRLMVKLINDFGAEEIRDALKDMPKEENADVVISTAHKSKGREWDTVRLGQDFPTVNKMTDADRRLLYVAATRAKMVLDISVCPPFCGGEDRFQGEGGMETRWVPGLKINYTVPMPTAQDQIDYLEAKKQEAAQPVEKKAQPEAQAIQAQPFDRQQVKAATAGKYTWTKFADQWCARGPKGTTVGATVSVERRDGSRQDLRIKRVVKQFDDAWIYEV